MAGDGKHKLDDDFIMTISDTEDIPNYDDDEEEEALPQTNGSTSLKRKRDTKKSKAKKKQKNKEVVEAEDSAEEEDQPQDDGAFNPDFEFDLGDTAGITAGFDEWAIPANGNEKANKPLGVDEIVARRRKQQQAEALERAEDDSDDEEELDGFEDDEEALADDAFGMAVEDEEENEDEVSEEQEDEEANEDSDADSVAAPVPHPLDLEPATNGLDDDYEDEPEEDPAEIARRTAFYAPEEPAEDSIKDNVNGGSFMSMNLSRPILKGLNAVGFSKPTPIQSKTIPVALLGKDIVGGAVTGSGKTAAFVLPILERLLFRSKKIPITRVGILMPTRELAVQCYNVATKIASFTDITFALIVGGLSLREQEATLKKRPDVVIATPGRFIDHMRNTASFVVENLEILVLDEADRMLEDGFADELNEILTTIPRSRQTMLFSATMTEDVDKLIRVGLNRPVRLMVDAKRQTVSGLVQEFIKLKPLKKAVAASDQAFSEPQRLATLLSLVLSTYTTRTIIFIPTKSLAHRLKVLFALHSVAAAELHGSMSQEQRLGAIAAFRDGTATHLLATDLASRGLDIPRVETVINYTVPTTTETYLHRVGRTARAGRAGVACTIFAGSKEGTTTTNAATGKKKSAKAAGERTLLRPILRVAKQQRASIRTRTLPADSVTALAAQIAAQQDEIDAVLKEEKEERLLAATERDVTKGENLVRHEAEILARPRRTWFQSAAQKAAAKEAGRDERLGVENPPPSGKKEKVKLSGKDRKRLASRDERKAGGVAGVGWKKGKQERMGGGALKREKDRRVEKKKARREQGTNAKTKK